MQRKYSQIEQLLNEIKLLILDEIGNNPYPNLEKLMRIVSDKNYNQHGALKSKLKNLSIIVYGGGLKCSYAILKKIEEISFLLVE